MPQVAKLVGGAGTGKTKALLDLMTGAVEKLGSSPMILESFLVMTLANVAGYAIRSVWFRHKASR